MGLKLLLLLMLVLTMMMVVMIWWELRVRITWASAHAYDYMWIGYLLYERLFVFKYVGCHSCTTLFILHLQSLGTLKLNGKSKVGDLHVIFDDTFSSLTIYSVPYICYIIVVVHALLNIYTNVFFFPRLFCIMTKGNIWREHKKCITYYEAYIQ